jgi:predicted RNA-binding Zn-ribbon protein involved in translation (DUF1610 family)
MIAPGLIELMFVFLALGFFVAYLLFRRKRASADPVCGKCGYQVRGLTTFTCPECGSDLREVGILSAAKPRKTAADSRLRGKIIAIVGVWICIGTVLGRLFAKQNDELVMPLWTVVLIAAISATVWHHRRASATTSGTSFDPAQPGSTRNLTIVFIDMHDYTARVASESREGVIDLIRKTRGMIQPIVQRRRGNIVKTIGDAFLITFDSPTEAVLTAREIQSAAATVDGIKFRIGISTGEVARAVGCLRRSRQHRQQNPTARAAGGNSFQRGDVSRDDTQ